MSFSARAVFRLRLAVVPLFLASIILLIALEPPADTPWTAGVTATLGVRN